MFQQHFDVPVQVDAPAPAATLRDATSEGLTFVLNGETVRAPRGEDGALAYTQTYVAQEPGTLTIPAPILRYAYATRFREDFVHGRVPLDRRDATVAGQPVVLTIRALPDPPSGHGFSGAVGQITVRAETTARAVEVGEMFKLVLRIDGAGNTFHTPRLALSDFHVYGSIDAGSRTITYDLAALRATSEIPAIPFVYFDPAAAQYRTVHTQPLPLSVAGAPRESEPEPAEERSLGWFFALGAALLGLAIWLRVRPRKSGPDAVARLRASDDIGVAFTEFLANGLGCPKSAIIGPDLEARLQAAGVPHDLAAKTAEYVKQQVGARYGGPTPKESATDLAKLLNRCFGTHLGT